MKRSCLLFISGACLPLLASAPVFAANPDSTEFSVEVKPYLNVTLSDADIHLPITPSSAGAFGSADFSASASTNSALGYSLNLSYLDNNNNPSTDLISNTINVNDGTFPTIPAFTTNDELTSEAFTASTSEDHLNHWAISVNDTAHYKKAVQGATIASSNGPIANDETTINLATKLDLRTVPGSYSVVMNFQVVANPDPEVDLDKALQNAGKRKVTVDDKEYYQIQDITKVICDNVNSYSVIDAVDTRDDNIYKVGKLRDGNCWLLDNLRLDPVASQANINENNTNAPSSVISKFYAENGGRVDGDSSTDRYATSKVKYFSGTGTYDEPLAFSGYNNRTITDTDKTDISGSENWKFGTYYNFCAMTIGSYCYGSGTNDGGAALDRPDTLIDAEYDICPANWRLPTGTQYGESQAFYKLYFYYDYDAGVSHSDYADLRNDLRVPLSGYHDGSGVWMQGDMAHITTSTILPNSPTSTTTLYISTYGADGMNGGGRRFGYPIRCVAK